MLKHYNFLQVGVTVPGFRHQAEEWRQNFGSLPYRLLLPRGGKAPTADIKRRQEPRKATPTKSHFQHFSCDAAVFMFFVAV